MKELEDKDFLNFGERMGSFEMALPGDEPEEVKHSDTEVGRVLINKILEGVK